jgi:menaquinone-9 beta-reductase
MREASQYEVIVVGGGIAGSALAANLAREGVSTLVLERETKFRDRIRGENVHPWGVAEAKTLGIDDVLRKGGAIEVSRFETRFGAPAPQRDLPRTTPHGLPDLNFYHPDAQEALLQHAAESGAEVWRGAQVAEVIPGDTPAVRLRDSGAGTVLRGRLVVGADGRSSLCRKAIAKEERRLRSNRLLAGVLLEDVAGGADANVAGIAPGTGVMSIFFPQGNGRARLYGAFRGYDQERLQGAGALGRLLEAIAPTGLPVDDFANARVAGPLATFDGDDSWVEHPFRDGVALIGDAAGISDPTWGQGLSLSWRDARVLRDELLKGDDYDAAGHRYADAHDEYFTRVITVEGWFRQLFLDTGREADALRARAMAKIAADPTRVPDHLFSGPDAPADEGVRKRYFGEE